MTASARPGENALSDADQIQVCVCGHYRFTHQDGADCKPMGRGNKRQGTTGKCHCKGFRAARGGGA